MALRRPVVALANGGTLDVVEHGKSGLLSEPGDIEGLAENLLTMICNDELRRKMGVYGRGQVESYYNPQRLTRDVAGVYENVLRGVAHDECAGPPPAEPMSHTVAGPPPPRTG